MITHDYDLGHFHRSISSANPEATVWFSRGLTWIYAFDSEMAQRCFNHGIENEAQCAMLHWGLAYSSGLYYNKPWHRMQTQELENKLADTYRISRQALEYLDNASPVEAALVQALVYRYQGNSPCEKSEYDRWNDDYADAMRTVYQAYPDDDDVCALFAEALMCRTPWALWDLQSGDPAAGASTLEAIDVLERAMEREQTANRKPHPGILHMYIHVMEMSPFPDRALPAANALRDLVPDSGHLCHMPSHIDVRCGHYLDAVLASDKAIAADRKYVKREGMINFHTLSRIHNFHLKIYAALFLGQYQAAMAAAEELVETTPEALLRIESPAMADWMEAYIGMTAHIYIRFGKWQEIIDAPIPDDPMLYCMTTAIWHYAKTIAYAATGQVSAAIKQKDLFQVAVKSVPGTRLLFNNTCADVLKIAEQMLLGEVEYRKENYDVAFQHLRNAVQLDDDLEYDEPWGWMQPARHALGALLLEQGYVDEAEQVYRDDLGLSDTLVSTSQHHDNLWSLHGLVECLERRGCSDEAKTMRARLNLAMARADVPIRASCACRLHTQCCDT